MIGIPVKILTFIAQAALVVMAVFVFSYFDPFNIFNSKKLTMRDTPVIVNSIKGIGILISAEYYGEVIKSTGEPLQLFVDSVRIAKENNLLQLEETIRRVARLDYRLDSIRRQIRTKDEYSKEFENRHGVFKTADKETYKNFLSIVIEKAHDEASMLFGYYTGNEVFVGKSGRPAFRDYVSEFGEKNYHLTRQDIRDTERDGLVLLGRGSVKAGIDFSNFDEKHFQYLPADNLVRLMNHPTSIVTASINPWFIPEKKIKGFDYIFVGNSLEKNPDSRNSVKIIQNLKSACLESLKADAKEAGIIARARENAEVTLGHFLTLLMGKNIRVEIFDHPLDAALHDILNARAVNSYVLHEVDSLVEQYVLTDYSRTYEFVRRIKDSLINKSFQLFPWKNANQNLETLALYFKISEDSFYTNREKLEYMKLSTARYDAKTASKSYLYKSESRNDTRLTKVSRPDSNQIRDAFNTRKEHFVSLGNILARLKTASNSRKIKEIDSRISDLLKKDKFRDAYELYLKNLEFATDDERENLNWRFVYFFVAASEHMNKDSLQVKYNKLEPEPTRVDVFYYLSQKGRLAKIENGNSSLDKLLTQYPEWKIEAKQNYQLHRRMVEDLLDLK